MAVPGLGRPAPSRFPYPGRPESAPGLGAAGGQIIRARKIIVTGPGGGMFVYLGRPALGNLIETAGIAVRGTDIPGNAYLAGDTTYQKISASQWQAANQNGQSVTFYYATSPAGPWNPIGTIAAAYLNFPAQAGPLIELSVGLALPGLTFLVPSGDTSGTTDTGNINVLISALPATGGTVFLLPGNWYVKCGQVIINKAGVYLRGAGRWATFINAVGTGDVIRMYNAAFGNNTFGGGVLDLTIDGTSAGAGSSGLHYGDNGAGEFSLAVQNFTGAGSIGVHFDNTIGWTEETHGYIWTHDCNRHVLFDVSGATTSTDSYGYSDLQIQMLMGANEDGVVIQNGSFFYHSRLTIKCDAAGSANPVSNAVLRITGQVPAGHPAAGNFSAIDSSRLDVQAECTSGPNTPTSILFGTPGSNGILACTGVLDFSHGLAQFTPSNWNFNQAASFTYEGIIQGDTNLNPGGSNIGVITRAAKGYGQGFGSGSTGQINVRTADFFALTLTANITVTLPGATAVPQRKTITITQAAAGGFTVTWPHAVAPTPAAPTVVWPGGVAPVMTAAANAVDVYKLETFDGATWYGQALQNVS